MKTAILSAITLLSTAAFAAPAPQATTTTTSEAASETSAGPFSLMAIRSGSELQYQPINAADTKFWIFKDTETYCPEGVAGLDCTKLGNTTQLQLYGDNLSMYDVVPGGQQVYVGPKGALRFTQAHSASMPKGSTVGGFSIIEYSAFGSIGRAGGFVACPTTKVDGKKRGHPYQIFVQVPGFKQTDCIGFDFAAVNTTNAPAWQYT
jgi:hypothetical protein